MLDFSKNSLTKITAIIIFATITFSHFDQKLWNQDGAMIDGDVKVYYAFLPALFIHNDIDFDDPFVYNNNGNLQVVFAEKENGIKYIKGTCGMAIIYAPFFFLGHSAAFLLGEPMDGFSPPYMFFLAMGTLIYLVIGMVFLSKLLLRYFEDHIVAITLLVIYLGTNLYFYYTGSMLYGHGFSFSLIALFLYSAVRWLDEPKLKWAIIIGISSGLFVLIRPIDIVFVFGILLIGVSSRTQFKDRVHLFWNKRGQVALMLLVALIMMIPQFMYNYHVWGKVLFNVYENTGESFFFLNPHLIDILISYRNGWLVYSPLMLFSVFGLIVLLKSKKGITRFILPIGLLYYFVIASWWCWWYVGFGNRAFINLYPLLAFPLAACVAYLLKQRVLIRVGFKFIVLGGIILSMYQTQQYRVGHIHWSDMTKEAYWDVFLKANPSELHSTFLRPVVINDQKNGINNIQSPIVTNIYSKLVDFDSPRRMDSTFSKFVSSGGLNSSFKATIPDGLMYIGDILIEPDTNANEVFISAWFKGIADNKTHITLYNSSRSFVKISHEISETKGGWSKLICYAVLPNEIRPDTLHFTIWNELTQSFSIDEIKIQGRRRTFRSIKAN